MSPDRRAMMIAREPILAEGNPRLPNLVITERMEAHGVPVLDLHPAFVSHMQGGGESVYWSSDNAAVHWNVPGNRIA